MSAKRFGDYELLGRLGEGATSSVHRARDPGGSVVALKVARAELPALERQRFLREGSAAEDFVHPNVVTPPRVVLTWPLRGASLRGSAEVYAVASDAGGAPRRVELLVNGALFGARTAPPYRFSLDTSRLSPGSHVLGARAVDAAGNERTDTVVVEVR